MPQPCQEQVRLVLLLAMLRCRAKRERLGTRLRNFTSTPRLESSLMRGDLAFLQQELRCADLAVFAGGSGADAAGGGTPSKGAQTFT